MQDHDQTSEEKTAAKDFLIKVYMIFHSRISENKVQSFITIAFYERVQCIVMGWVAVLLHWLVLGREAVVRTAIKAKEILTIKHKPVQALSGFD